LTIWSYEAPGSFGRVVEVEGRRYRTAFGVGFLDEGTGLGPDMFMIFSCTLWQDECMEIVTILGLCTNTEIGWSHDISRNRRCAELLFRAGTSRSNFKEKIRGKLRIEEFLLADLGLGIILFNEGGGWCVPIGTFGACIWIGTTSTKTAEQRGGAVIEHTQFAKNGGAM